MPEQLQATKSVNNTAFLKYSVRDGVPAEEVHASRIGFWPRSLAATHGRLATARYILIFGQYSPSRKVDVRSIKNKKADLTGL